MMSAGIVVGPMDDPAFGIPFIFAAETDFAADFQSVDARSQIDVVTDQNRQSIGQANDKTLMPGTAAIIGKNFYNDPR